MKKHFLTWILSFAGSLILLSAANAHHGWGGYKDRVEGEFTIIKIKLGNPHDRLIATDAKGQEWNLLLAPPLRNRRFGFNEESVSVGDVIEILGQKHPKRMEMKVHCIYVEGENIYTYRYDNGRTSLQRRRGNESCERN
jgi:hypothetical protein